MYARVVDDAAARLRALKREELEDFSLAAVTYALAVAATRVLPSLALPLLAGGVFVSWRGVKALWRRWDLVEVLAGERDAYVISEVRTYASRVATIERRRWAAGMIRLALREPGTGERIAPVAQELDALASELENVELELEPVCAVTCSRLVTDGEGSPLINPALPVQDLFSKVRQIRAGFIPAAGPRALPGSPVAEWWSSRMWARP